MSEPDLAIRAERFAALGDPTRLAIVDALAISDRSPGDLVRAAHVPSNLLAHHLDVLERVGLISRHRSSGDARRRYVRLEHDAMRHLLPGRTLQRGPALFICSQNSARSQMAAALWQRATGKRAMSAGTHPAHRVHPGAVAAARRAGMDIAHEVPRHLDEIRSWPALVVTVCDQAHEELGDATDHLHWSIDDPVAVATAAAFDRARDSLDQRIAGALEAGASA